MPVLNEAGQEVPKFLKSMAARGPVQNSGIVSSGQTRSDRDIGKRVLCERGLHYAKYQLDCNCCLSCECADQELQPEVEIQKIGADLAAFGAPTTTDDDPGFWSD